MLAYTNIYSDRRKALQQDIKDCNFEKKYFSIDFGRQSGNS